VQVRADLESAAKLLQKRALKHADSNNSNASGSTIFMPPPPAPGQGFAGKKTALPLVPFFDNCSSNSTQTDHTCGWLLSMRRALRSHVGTAAI
jgi:hypothetical protein